MLAHAIDIRTWLHQDRQTPFDERLTRDRGIGRRLDERSDVARVLSWWRQIDAAPGDSVGQRAEDLRRLASGGLMLLGIILGASTCGVSFTYQGDYPVNLFTLLGLLVGLPLLLLLFSLLLLPGRIPGLGAVQGMLAGLNLARWVGAWLDRYLRVELFAPAYVGRRQLGAFARWQLVVFSQWLAVGFFVGVLVLALLLVAFTDLAFGWSTTLDANPQVVARSVDLLAAPWAAWLPAAAPDASLVGISRYFRLEQGGMPATRVAALGDWWPFVLMVILCYGLLPRLLLLGVGAWRLRRAGVALLREDPEVTALLDRLRMPLVSLSGEAENADQEPGLRAGAPRLPAELLVGAGACPGIIWNNALPGAGAAAWAGTRLSAALEPVLQLDSMQSEGARQLQLQQLPRACDRLVIFTKGWEPPLLEFLDIVQLLRERLGSATTIVVVPVDVAGRQVRGADRDVWAHTLARLADGRLYVMQGEDAT